MYLSVARVVKLVDTADLKSAASLIAGVPVRFRSRAPIIIVVVTLHNTIVRHVNAQIACCKHHCNMHTVHTL